MLCPFSERRLTMIDISTLIIALCAGAFSGVISHLLVKSKRMDSDIDDLERKVFLLERETEHLKDRIATLEARNDAEH